MVSWVSKVQTPAEFVFTKNSLHKSVVLKLGETIHPVRLESKTLREKFQKRWQVRPKSGGGDEEESYWLCMR